MLKIQVLQPHIANQIAAGEVVERPASIVKELVENSIDAGATQIEIEIKNGGIDYIRVADNGHGIPFAEALLAFERHATSKIQTQEDLQQIETLGFRGEALNSIAAVAQVALITLAREEEAGTHIRMEGGTCTLHAQTGAIPGTAITVENLFFNVPARRKFLKSTRTEAGAIGELVSRQILAHPEIAFRYSNNGRLIYQSTGDGELKTAIYCIFGKEVLPHIREVAFDNGYTSITGFIGTQAIARPNRRDQVFLLNGRVIRFYALSNAVQRAYDTRLMGGKYAFAVLHIRLASREVDVNVHPNKLEVRFAQEGKLFAAMVDACAKAFGPPAIPQVQFSREMKHTILHGNTSSAPAAKNDEESVCKEDQPTTGGIIPKIPPAFLQAQATSGGNLKLEEPIGDANIPHFLVRNRPNILVVHSADTNTLYDAQTTIAPVLQHALPKQPSPGLQLAAAELPRSTSDFDQAEQQQFGEVPICIIGQAYQAYWIVQQAEDLFIIDQHAAHERKLYEALIGLHHESASQQLLVPELLQLSPHEYAVLEDNMASLKQLGFGFEPFGPSTLRIYEVPAVLADVPVGALLRDALEILSKQGAALSQELRREMIIQSACKHAIKAGDAISKQEIEALLHTFHEHGAPMTCPHGRPVMLRLSRRDLEKMFRRIV